MKKIPLNLPNILSLYRLASFPFVLTIELLRMEKLFVWLICINLVTDILDGLIARAFNMKTEIGAKLDSIADDATYILVFTGIFLFKWADFRPHAFSFFTFFGLFLFCNLLSVIKFGRFPSLHLYSWKVCGYVQGFFFFTLFVFGFNTSFYYFMVISGTLAFIENIIIQLMIRKMISNAKGLYWVIGRRKEEKNGLA